MERIEINDFEREVEVAYKGDVYSVRDNGSIMRHAKNASKPRPLDNIWTFGKRDEKNGYLSWAGQRVHIIVCLAFNGEPQEKGMVVDHIDTNRCNNRPDNLRWLTKLENALNNQITRQKIIMCCGSIEAFIENPSILRKHANQNPNFEWMSACTNEQAKNAYCRLTSWATRPVKRLKLQPQTQTPQRHKIDENIYTKTTREEDLEFTPSLTVNAIQQNWRTENEFPCCPPQGGTIEDYYNNIIEGDTFCKSKYNEKIVVKKAINESYTTIWVVTYCEKGIKNWFLSEITFDGKYFVHTNKHSFFKEDGAEKYYTLAQGKEWTGGDVEDDFC